MITTIQLDDSVKRALDRIKETKETYEQVILNLLRFADEQQRKQKNLLIEGYQEMAEESLKITKEFEAVENLDDWEWNGNL